MKNIVFINGNCTTDFNIDNKYYFKGAVNFNKGSDGSFIDNCTFKDNQGTHGGAIYWTSNDGTLTNSRFDNNIANSTDIDHITAQGGAIYWSGNNSIIDNTNFTENSAPRHGGAIYYYGANNQLINNSYFYKNRDYAESGFLGGGGAIYYASSSNGRIVNTNFTENYVMRSGGAIYYDKNSKNQTLANSSFMQNTAGGLSGNNPPGAPSYGYGGGAIYWIGSDGSIEDTNFTENSANMGGAVYYYTGSDNQTITGSSFTNNTATMDATSGTINAAPGGGAIYWTSNNGKVSNSNFTENSAKLAGGAIYYKGDNQTITDSSFTGNTANGTNKAGGGAIFCNGVGDALIKNSNFTENSAVSGSGGAIYNYKGTDDQTITDSTFYNNTAKNSGGAIYYDTNPKANIKNADFAENSANGSGGAISFSSSGYGTIENTNFTENSAKSLGGAISISSSPNTEIKNVDFTENTANASGGAISISSSANINIKDVDFSENSANVSGGAVYATSSNYMAIEESSFSKNTANGTGSNNGGGAIWTSSSYGTIDNVNLTENSAYKQGGAIFYSNAKNQTINNSAFSKNTANGTTSSNGGAIYYYSSSTNSSIENTNFTENSAKASGGAIYYATNAVNSSIKNADFNENSAPTSGGAIYSATKNQTIADSSFSKNTANGSTTSKGGAIYYSSAVNTSIENTNFTENSAKGSGGAIYSDKVNNQTITDSSFSNNNVIGRSGTAYGGGAVYYTASSNSSIENTNFTGNYILTGYGGAVYTAANTESISDSVFNGNNATSGSAIYHDKGSLSISSAELLENQANASSLTGNATVEGFDATIHTQFKGRDNLLNAIYTKEHEAVELTDVTYWGANGKMNTGSSKVTPVASVDDSNDGELVYIDDREAGINITVSIYDADGNFIKNITGKTDIYGDINISNLGLTPGKYKAKAIHEEDNYYTEIVSKEFEFEILKANSTVNGTDETEVYKNPVVVTVASENATAVIYNITDSKGTVVVPDTSVDANGTFTVPVNLDVGEYTVNYKTVVDEEYYNINTNSSKITITPAPSSVNAEDVEKVYGEEITVTVASENATQVTYNITNSEGTVVVANTTVDANGEFTVPVALDVGEYTVTLTTIVDGNHISNTSTSKITITPAASSISAEDVEKVYSDDVVLIASGDNSTGINESTVVVRDAEGNIVDATVTVSDDFTITIIGLDAGEYKVSYTNTVDKNHITASNVTNVVVLKIDTAVSNESASDKPGKKVTVDFTVDDQKGNPVRNGNLTVTVDGKEYVVNVTDGKDTFKDIILPDTPGKYNYEVSYSGEDNYNPSVGQLNLTVQKVDVIVTLPEVINYTGAVVDIVVEVIDEYGNPVNEGTVNLVIDFGTKLSNKLMATALSNTAEVSDGKAVFKDITLGEPGKYPSYAQYSGSDYYNEAENTSDVIVLPLNTTTESQDVSGHSGDKKDITADIVDQNGNPVKNGTAVLKVNGKEYTAEVKDGKAIFKNVELPSESTDATIDYLGNEYYNPSSTTIKITISEDEEQEGGDEPINGTEDKNSTANAVKAVSVLPSTGNPIALVILALLTLVSTVSLGNKK